MSTADGLLAIVRKRDLESWRWVCLNTHVEIGVAAARRDADPDSARSRASTS
jgi:hypothetical protein